MSPALFMSFLSTKATLISLLAVCVLLIILIVHLEIRVHLLLKGQNGKSLESLILSLKKGLEKESHFKKEMERYLTGVEKRLSGGARSIHTVRFNAFKGTGSGGNQSFATAFINENGDGVIISSLHARGRVSIFAKPLKTFSSEFELTPEEKEALDQAKANL